MGLRQQADRLGADDLAAFVEATADTVWAPLLAVMVLLGVAWMGWHALGRQRATASIQGLVWMVAIVALATLLFSQPAWFFSGADELSSRLATEVFAGIAGISGGDDGDYYGNQAPTYGGNTDDERARRQAADHIWRVLVWQPWRAVVFANDRDADQFGQRLLADPSEDTQQAIRDDLERRYGEQAYPVQHLAAACVGWERPPPRVDESASRLC